MFKTIENALMVLGEANISSDVKAQAHQFLESLEPQTRLRSLVEALRSDHFVVRWEAGKLLTEMGRPALNEILQALVDPQKVGDARLREGAYHVLCHHRDPAVRQLTRQLCDDLHGGYAADLRTLHDAHHLLQEISGHYQSY